VLLLTTNGAIRSIILLDKNINILSFCNYLEASVFKVNFIEISIAPAFMPGIDLKRQGGSIKFIILRHKCRSYGKVPILWTDTV